MKAKKTVEIKELVEYANKLLAMPENEVYMTRKFKEGIITMLEKSLHLANAYDGFTFLNNEDSDINTFGYVTRKYYAYS